MNDNSESFLSSQKSMNEEAKTEGKVLEAESVPSTNLTERTDNVQQNVFLTSYLQQYMTATLREEPSLGPIEPTVTACRIDNDELLVAAGCDDGIVRLYMPDQAKYFGHVIFTEEPGNAVLDLKWRPTQSNDMTEHVFLASDVFGNLYHVHATSKKILHKFREEGNQVYALDYNRDGSKFATGGKDCQVRVYDEQKKSNCSILRSSSDIPTHENRILAMKFSPQQPEILLTGSWDETVKVWDLRSGEVVKSLFGLKVYGDSLDIDNNTILVGNNRDHKQLQLWDLGTKKLIEDIKWDPNPPTNYYDASVSVAKFSKNSPNYIIAFSGIAKELRIFDRRNGNTLCYAGRTPGEVVTVDFFNTLDKFIYGGSCGALHTYTIS